MAKAACSLAPAETQTRVFPAGTIKRIHVNMHIIRSNIKTGDVDPVTTVQWRGKSYRFATVEITGPSTVIYSPNKPLGCGARVWVETTTEVVGRA
ncbi:hypothetical protein [Sphingorhabdus sp.]|uniref:hypothetical protein n=1 Tax=Sphingorhabdus sp. TaxID=1902408 RepID=UPI00333F61EC